MASYSTSDFYQVLMALKENINRDLHVADLAKVNSVDGDNVQCQALNSDAIINCVKFFDLTVYSGDIVLVIYCDTDFHSNLSKYKFNAQSSIIEAKEFHSMSNGVVVGVVYRS